MIIILMGVSGSGKTTIGARLAQALGWPFYDGDQFHPPANVAKMQQGMPLTDEDRWPWLHALQAHIGTCIYQGVSAVLACSALKQAYRERLSQGARQDLVFVYLKGDATTIEPRLALRSGHYMPASLLASQFAALEEPTGAIVVDIRQTPKAQATEIAAQLRSLA